MVTLRSAAPPVASRLQQWILADYAELHLLRAGLRQVIDAQALTPGRELDDVTERLVIVATELTTNALNHANSEAVVGLSRTRTAFILDVADELPSVAPQMVEQHPSRAGGRGLHITQELAVDTGWYLTSGSKHVWAEFTIPRRSRRSVLPKIPVCDSRAFLRLIRRIGH